RIPARGGDLGGCDTLLKQIGRPEERTGHAQRLEHPVVQELVEPFTAHLLHYEAQRDGAKIRIDVARAGLRVERRGEHDLPRFLRRLRQPPEVAISWQAGAVLEQLSNRDRVLVSAR